jgi:FG-GAP-like repeat
LIDEFATPTLFIHLRTADIDRDGDVDAVAADHRNGNIVYYENPGRGVAKANRWPKHLVDDRAVGAHAVAIGDINGDGRIDIVASGEKEAAPPQSVYWYACPEKPNEVERWPKYIVGQGRAGVWPTIQRLAMSTVTANQTWCMQQNRQRAVNGTGYGCSPKIPVSLGPYGRLAKVTPRPQTFKSRTSTGMAGPISLGRRGTTQGYFGSKVRT